MIEEWNVKKTIRCAWCGADVEFKLYKEANTSVPYHFHAVKGVKFGIFDTDGDNRFTEEEFTPIPLCEDCCAALEKLFEYSDEPDCEEKEEQQEADLISQSDSLECIADELEDAGDWIDQSGNLSISESELREWSDRIRKLAEKEDGDSDAD